MFCFFVKMQIIKMIFGRIENNFKYPIIGLHYYELNSLHVEALIYFYICKKNINALDLGQIFIPDNP